MNSTPETLSVFLLLGLFLLYYLAVTYLPFVLLALVLLRAYQYHRGKNRACEDLPRRKHRLIVASILFAISCTVSFVVLVLFRQSLRFM